MKKGFTLVELIIVMAILISLFTLGSINILNTQKQSSASATVSTLISDIRFQQSKAMLGQTDGGQEADTYGIHILGGQYVLFKGSVYSESDPGNTVIDIDPNFSLGTSFLDNTIVFSQGSGEIVGYLAGADQIELVGITDTSSVLLTLNQYGVVVSQN